MKEKQTNKQNYYSFHLNLSNFGIFVDISIWTNGARGTLLFTNTALYSDKGSKSKQIYRL